MTLKNLATTLRLIAFAAFKHMRVKHIYTLLVRVYIRRKVWKKTISVSIKGRFCYWIYQPTNENTVRLGFLYKDIPWSKLSNWKQLECQIIKNC